MPAEHSQPTRVEQCRFSCRDYRVSAAAAALSTSDAFTAAKTAEHELPKLRPNHQLPDSIKIIHVERSGAELRLPGSLRKLPRRHTQRDENG
jgi:hypothetical protein